MRPEDRQGHNPPRCSSQPLRSRQPAYITVYWSIAKVALQNIQPTHVTMYWSIANTKVAQNTYDLMTIWKHMTLLVIANSKVALKNIQPTSQYWSIATTK